MPDLVEVYAEDERRDDQGRVTKAASLVTTTPALVAPMSAAARQREYGQELEATHEAWFPANLALPVGVLVVVRVARSDPSLASRPFVVKSLMNAGGRVQKATLAPAPLA